MDWEDKIAQQAEQTMYDDADRFHTGGNGEPEPTLIDKFYDDDPKVFLEFIGDALVEHEESLFLPIQVYMRVIREGGDERAFGRYMYELINNWMLDASKRLE